jgi:ribonuclease HI
MLVVEELVDHSKPWAYFDGASKNEGQICGEGVVLHMLASHSYNLKMGLGQGTNNFVEMMALKILVTFMGGK